MTILVTGFDRFGDLAFNPTERLVAQWAKSKPFTGEEELIAKVLPTAYVAAASEIEVLIREARPSIVLGFGLSRSRDRICLERFALNLDDASIEDNAGCMRTGEEIERGGPAAVKTNVDVAAVLKRLVDHRVDAEISNHAGTFVCNHVYYRTLRALERQRSQTPCLFVHVPMTAADPALDQASTDSRWHMSDLRDAAGLILEQLARQKRRSPSRA